MTTDEVAEATATTGTDAADGGTDAADASDAPADDAPPLEFERKAITVCLIGVGVGSVLPWVSVDDGLLYGFDAYRMATLFLATFAGTLASRLEWDGRAMVLSFVAGILVTAMAMSYVLLVPSIGSVLTALSGGIAAYLALGGFLKSR